MNNWDRIVVIIQNVTKVLWAVASLLAPWVVPFAPATFLGWSVYVTAIRSGMPQFLAVAAAAAAGVGLETVNIAANHAMQHLSHNWKSHWPKFVFSVSLVLAYMSAGIWSMSYLDMAQGIRVLGIAMFALAPVAISAQALTMDLARVQEDVKSVAVREDHEHAWGLRQKEEQAKREFELRLAELEVQKQVKLEQTRLNAEIRKERERLKSVGNQQPDLTLRREKPDAKAIILTYFNSNGSVRDLNDLVKAVGLERRVVAEALLDLEKTGQVKRNGDKVWVPDF